MMICATMDRHVLPKSSLNSSQLMQRYESLMRIDELWCTFWSSAGLSITVSIRAFAAPFCKDYQRSMPLVSSGTALFTWRLSLVDCSARTLLITTISRFPGRWESARWAESLPCWPFSASHQSRDREEANDHLLNSRSKQPNICGRLSE